ncbi:MAG TPA: 3-methylornithyl-N6-L-lysine dehydrogenase PylD [Coriobacteriia bacterium]|nr:3-methylornithyl-N6-L-lysine dehydrogenase PylD [Coriobacteriia bacterium]
MTRLSDEHIVSINRRLPLLEQRYLRITGKNMLDIARYAAGTEYLPLRQRKTLSVACVPITAGEGLIGHFCETVAGILEAFADVKAYVTEATDVRGFNEAIVRDADLVFMADDDMCLCRNLRTGATSDNGYATGRAFASLLYLAMKEKITEDVLILGAGKVGVGAYSFLRKKGLDALHWFDICRQTAFSGPLDSERYAVDWQNREWRYLIDATTCPTFIDSDQVRADAVLAAPGIPFGLTEGAVEKAELVIHDELETGIMVMFCEAMRG